MAMENQSTPRMDILSIYLNRPIWAAVAFGAEAAHSVSLANRGGVEACPGRRCFAGLLTAPTTPVHPTK